MTIQYKYKAFGNVRGLKAQHVGEELERIRLENGGELRAEQVVAAAKPKDALLHNVFDWNNKRAAERFRLVQAQQLIRSVEIKILDGKPIAPVRAFVNVVGAQQHYTSTIQAMTDLEYRQQTLDKAISELAAFRQKYAALDEFSRLFEVFDELQAAA